MASQDASCAPAAEPQAFDLALGQTLSTDRVVPNGAPERCKKNENNHDHDSEISLDLPKAENRKNTGGHRGLLPLLPGPRRVLFDVRNNSSHAFSLEPTQRLGPPLASDNKKCNSMNSTFDRFDAVSVCDFQHRIDTNI